MRIIKPYFTQNKITFLLLQTLVVSVLVVALVAWQHKIIAEVYWGPLATEIGIVVNSVILVLFFLALVRMLYLLLFYRRENRAINQFDEQMDFGLTDAGVENIESSLVVRRYRTLQQGRLELEQPQQSALLGILWSQESARLSLVRLIQNVMILLGVFGTVVSLSLALIGASELFTSAQNTSGITSVVRGMATALSTTMTAIAAFLVLAFILSRVTNAQAYVCQRIESLTLRRMMPLVARATGSLSQNLLYSLKGLQEVVQDLKTTHEELQKQTEYLAQQHEARGQHEQMLIEQLRQSNRLLRQGFRLPNTEN